MTPDELTEAARVIDDECVWWIPDCTVPALRALAWIAEHEPITLAAAEIATSGVLPEGWEVRAERAAVECLHVTDEHETVLVVMHPDAEWHWNVTDEDMVTGYYNDFDGTAPTAVEAAAQAVAAIGDGR